MHTAFLFQGLTKCLHVFAHLEVGFSAGARAIIKYGHLVYGLSSHYHG